MLGVELCDEIGSNNDAYYCNRHYDELYQEQATELNYQRRVALVHETQQYFYDYCNYIVMWYQQKLQAYRTDTWTGWKTIRGGIILNFTRNNYLNVRPVTS